MIARGSTGQEKMALQINGKTVRIYNKVRSERFRPYRYKTPKKLSIAEIRVRFTNNGVTNGQDRNLHIDRVHLDGKSYQSESPSTYSTGTWKNGSSAPGNKMSQTLHVNGYFQYAAGGSSNSGGNSNSGGGSGWTLTFSDEFVGNQVDRNKWNTNRYFGSINNEQQGYSKDQLEVSNGKLKIYAERKPIRFFGKNKEFTSGMITTKNKFFQTYGKFEIRAKLPRGNGYWPAMWTILQRPAQLQDEIDVMETVGNLPTLASFNHHYLDSQGRHQSNYQQWFGPDFTAGFHTYACDWDSNSLVWYVDGVERARVDGNYVPQEDMYIVLNLAVGGGFPDATDTPPDATTPQKSALEVEYVRVYKRR